MDAASVSVGSLNGLREEIPVPDFGLHRIFLLAPPFFSPDPKL
jgi:hypothetical protein